MRTNIYSPHFNVRQNQVGEKPSGEDRAPFCPLHSTGILLLTQQYFFNMTSISKFKHFIITFCFFCGLIYLSIANAQTSTDKINLTSAPTSTFQTDEQHCKQNTSLNGASQKEHWDGLNANEKPWALLFYWGRTTDHTLHEVLETNYGGLIGETLYSGELSYRLAQNNPATAFFHRFLWVNSTELNANFTYRDDVSGSIYEGNPYFSIRWAHFPWDKYIVNSFAVGEGISYDTHISSVETDLTTDGGTRRLLNFLMFEATFALPSHPHIELLARIHHRSGAFGLYGAENSGSSAIGLGIRYRF